MSRKIQYKTVKEHYFRKYEGKIILWNLINLTMNKILINRLLKTNLSMIVTFVGRVRKKMHPDKNKKRKQGSCWEVFRKWQNKNVSLDLSDVKRTNIYGFINENSYEQLFDFKNEF